MSLVVKKEVLRKPTNKHQSWCFKRGYMIYPKLVGKDSYKIVLSNGEKEREGAEYYTKKTLTKGIWDLYLKLYDRWHEQRGIATK